MKVTGDKKAYATGDPRYAAVTPITCYVSTAVALAAGNRTAEALRAEDVTGSIRDNREFTNGGQALALAVNAARIGIEGGLITLQTSAKLDKDIDALDLTSQLAVIASRAVWTTYPDAQSIQVILDKDGAPTQSSVAIVQVNRATGERFNYDELRKKISDDKYMFCVADRYRISSSIFTSIKDTGCLAGPSRSDGDSNVAAPLGNACPADQSIKATQLKRLYPTDHPEYATANPVACFASADSAAPYGYVAASRPASQSAPSVIGQSSETQQRQTYLNAFISESQMMAASFDRFSRLLTSPRLGDGTWSLAVATELALWQGVYSEAQRLSPPSCLSVVHQRWLAALKEFDTASNLTAKGLDTSSVAVLQQAIGHADQGGVFTKETTQLINASKC